MKKEMRTEEFEKLLQEKTEAIEAVLRAYLPKEEGYQKTVLEAMNYSLLAGGKRLRPMLLWEMYRLFGGTGKLAEPFMVAIEMIHTYSLVHDDLPAMDNDEYRRGRKTTWSVYGEGMGILAGDGLLNFAFETALGAASKNSTPDEAVRVLRALKILAGKAGVYGMIGGQTADIEAENQTNPLTEEQLLFIHEKKTAALIQASMMIGAVLAGAGEEQISSVEKCAYNIGIAFQIQDDILDVVGDSRELGKQAGSDARNNKQTYVTQNGLEKSREMVEALSEEAQEILRKMSLAEKQPVFLEKLIEQLIHRRK